MKNFYSFLLSLSVLFSSIPILAQQSNKGNNFFKLSGGKVFFGTGDVPGYGVNLEYSTRLKIAKKPSKHFLFGAEISFENGSIQPKVINPTFQEFIDETYHSTTNIILTPKISYYPFAKTFAKGINITGGISVGYTNQNMEFQSTYIYDNITQMSVRRSYLKYINQVLFGYRITTGYELFVTKKILIGGHLGFSSYTNGDINTSIIGKLGYNF